MSVTFTALADRRPVVDVDGERVECNFHNAGAAAVLAMLGVSDPYLVGELDVTETARALMVVRATFDRTVRPYLVEPRSEGNVHHGGLTAESLERRLDTLAEVVRGAIDYGADRICYG